MRLIIFTALLLSYSFPGHSESVEEGRYVGLYSGYANSSSDLTGTGFNAKLPARGSAIYGGDLSFKADGADTRFNLKYEKTTFDMSAPTGVTPTTISAYREDVRLMASFSPWDSGTLENLSIGLGYGILRTGATDTLTYNVLNKQTSQGPLFGVGYKWKFKQDWILQSDLMLYLPHRVIESPQITGANGQMIGAEARLSVDYMISESFTAFIGATYRMDRASFDGTETRGVTGGVDTRTYIAIPVGIKIGY